MFHKDHGWVKVPQALHAPPAAVDLSVLYEGLYNNLSVH